MQNRKPKTKKYILTRITNYELVDKKTFNLLSQAFNYGAQIYKKDDIVSVFATNCEIGEIEDWIYENGKWQVFGICGQF